MKRIPLFLLVLLSLVVGACAAGSVPTAQPVGTDLPRSTPTRLPGATSTSTATPTASPTPIFTLDPSSYDPDIFPAGVVQHQPPLIARADETVMLAFFLVDTIYCEQLQRYCRMEPWLYYSYGDDAFQSKPLVIEIVDGMEQWAAHLPAADQTGRSLHYYAEFSFPEAGYIQRYPIAGTMDLFAVPDFIPVELSPEKPVEPADEVYMLYWGYGPDTVRTELGRWFRIGPSAMEVAGDGRIALLNPVNDRILIYDPKEAAFSSVPLPFAIYADEGDIAFDANDRLIVCDFAGEEVRGIPERLPYCYRLLADGEVDASTPVYVSSPMLLTRGLKVLNDYDYRLTAPFDPYGEPNSREVQRQQGRWEFPRAFVKGRDGFHWHNILADVEAGVVFEIQADYLADPMAYEVLGFERTPQGYLMALRGMERGQVRAVWIDPAGRILKDVTLPQDQYHVLPLYSQVAIAQDGSLYLMSSTRNGIEIHFEKAP